MDLLRDELHRYIVCVFLYVCPSFLEVPGKRVTSIKTLDALFAISVYLHTHTDARERSNDPANSVFSTFALNVPAAVTAAYPGNDVFKF